MAQALVVFLLRLKPEVHKRLSDEAREKNISLTALIVSILETYQETMFEEMKEQE